MQDHTCENTQLQKFHHILKISVKYVGYVQFQICIPTCLLKEGSQPKSVLFHLFPMLAHRAPLKRGKHVVSSVYVAGGNKAAWPSLFNFILMGFFILHLINASFNIFRQIVATHIFPMFNSCQISVVLPMLQESTSETSMSH